MRIYIRYGAHGQNGLLTPRGKAEVTASAEELVVRLKAANITEVALICSLTWSGLESMIVIGSILDTAGLKIHLVGPKLELGGIKNAPQLMEALKVTYGQGMMAAWAEAGQKLPPVAGTPFFRHFCSVRRPLMRRIDRIV